MNTTTMNSQQLLWKINDLQSIQMNCSPDSREWNEASKVLAPLFSEMAKRQIDKAAKEKAAQS